MEDCVHVTDNKHQMVFHHQSLDYKNKNMFFNYYLIIENYIESL